MNSKTKPSAYSGQLDFIIEHAGKRPVSWIADATGRTEDAIRNVCKRNGISVAVPGTPNAKKSKVRPWSDSEIEVLLGVISQSKIGNVDIGGIAIKLGRSEESVKGKLRLVRSSVKLGVLKAHPVIIEGNEKIDALISELKKKRFNIPCGLDSLIGCVTENIENGRYDTVLLRHFLVNLLRSSNQSLVSEFIHRLTNSSLENPESSERSELEIHFEYAAKKGITPSALNALAAHPRFRSILVAPQKFCLKAFRFCDDGFVGVLNEIDALPHVEIPKFRPSAFVNISLKKRAIIDRIESIEDPFDLSDIMILMYKAHKDIPSCWFKSLSISDAAYTQKHHNLICSDELLRSMQGFNERDETLKYLFRAGYIPTVEDFIEAGMLLFGINETHSNSRLSEMFSNEAFQHGWHGKGYVNDAVNLLITSGDRVHALTEKIAALHHYQELDKIAINQLIAQPSLLRITEYCPESESHKKRDFYWNLIKDILLSPNGIKLFINAPDIAIAGLGYCGDYEINYLYRRGLSEARVLKAIEQSLKFFVTAAPTSNIISAYEFGSHICHLATLAKIHSISIHPYLRRLSEYIENVAEPNRLSNIKFHGLAQGIRSLECHTNMDKLWGDLERSNNPHLIIEFICANRDLAVKGLILKVARQSKLLNEITKEDSEAAWRLALYYCLKVAKDKELQANDHRDPIYKLALLLNELNGSNKLCEVFASANMQHSYREGVNRLFKINNIEGKNICS